MHGRSEASWSEPVLDCIWASACAFNGESHHVYNKLRETIVELTFRAHARMPAHGGSCSAAWPTSSELSQKLIQLVTVTKTDDAQDDVNSKAKCLCEATPFEELRAFIAKKPSDNACQVALVDAVGVESFHEGRHANVHRTCIVTMIKLLPGK